MTKDKREIENLLKNYRDNKAEAELITVMGIDYSSVKIQSSNITSLDDVVIKLAKLKKNLAIVDALIKCLNNKEKFIIESFYKEGRKLMWIGASITIDTENGVAMAKKEAIKKMDKIYNRNIKYFEAMEGLGN
jgi:DNA-directed RNA polymerase specialized sigma subunit